MQLKEVNITNNKMRPIPLQKSHNSNKQTSKMQITDFFIKYQSLVHYINWLYKNFVTIFDLLLYTTMFQVL